MIPSTQPQVYKDSSTEQEYQDLSCCLPHEDPGVEPCHIKDVKFFFGYDDEEVAKPGYKTLPMNVAKVWLPQNCVYTPPDSPAHPELPEWLSKLSIYQDISKYTEKKLYRRFSATAKQNNGSIKRHLTESDAIRSGVHHLFATVFANEDDRRDLARSMFLCDYIAIGKFVESTAGNTGTKANSKQMCYNLTFQAYGAITYFVCDDHTTAFISYLSTEPHIPSIGLGTFLLSLLIKSVMSKAHKGHGGESSMGVSVLLQANYNFNLHSIKFYEHRGFKSINTETDDGSLPPAILEKCKDPPYNFFWPKEDEEGVVWMYLPAEWSLTISPTQHNAPSHYPVDPYLQPNEAGVFTDESIYAQFPGGLNINEAEWCGVGMELLGTEAFRIGGNFNSAEQRTTAASTTSPTASPRIIEDTENRLVTTNLAASHRAYMDWRERLRIRAGPGYCDEDGPINIAIAWLQRNHDTLPLWNDRVTIVPQHVGLMLYVSYDLFRKYKVSQAMINRGGKSRAKALGIFDPKFDSSRMLNPLRVVLQFILLSPKMLMKPFLILLTMDHGNICEHFETWGCFVAVNAGQINPSDNFPQQIGKPTCGFLHFNPVASDNLFPNLPIDSENPSLFFLTLAYYIWMSDVATLHPTVAELRQSLNKFQDCGPNYNPGRMSVINAFCDRVCSTTADNANNVIFKQCSMHFGRPFDSVAIHNTFQGSQHFVQIQMPPLYRLHCLTEEAGYSFVYSFMFLLDICQSLVHIDLCWQPTGNMKPQSIPGSPFLYALPNVSNLGKLWQSRIVLSSQKKKKALTNQVRLGKASYISRWQMIYEVICLCDRLHHTLLVKKQRKPADDRDYQLFIGDVYRNLKSKLLERFEEGTIIQDIATGYCAWEPKVGPSLDSQGPSHNHLDELARAASYMSPLQQNLVQGNVTGESCNPDNLESDDDFQDCLDGGGGGSHSNVGAKNCAADGNALSKQQDEVEAVWMESDLLLECPTRKWMKGQKLPYFNLQHNRRPKTVHKINWDIEASDNANPVKKKRKSCNQKRRYKPPGFISCDCAAGELCKRPGGSMAIGQLDNAACCQETTCKKWVHAICLQHRNKQSFCPNCIQSPAKKTINDQNRNAGLSLGNKAKRSDTTLNIPKLPSILLLDASYKGDELSDKHTNSAAIIRDMRQVLDEEMACRGFKTMSAMKSWMESMETAIGDANCNWQHLSMADKKTAVKSQMEYLQTVKLWNKTHKALKRAYLATTPSLVKAIRYDSQKKRFDALVEWHDGKGSETRTQTATLPIEDNAWVRETFDAEVVDYVEQCGKLGPRARFLPVPVENPVMVDIDGRVISHLRCLRGGSANSGVRFRCKYAGLGDLEEDLDEAYVREMFPSVYVESVIQYSQQLGRRGFVHIPPGDIVNREGLDIPDKDNFAHAHKIMFKQVHDTCVYSSFASALWCVGIHDVAKMLASSATSTMHNSRVMQLLACEMNGHWLQARRLKRPRDFDILKYNLTDCIAVVTLQASDGGCSHAITVHDGLIFDSNEEHALLLTQANLDYICSTVEQRASFEGIIAGYLFVEQGNRQRLALTKKNLPGMPWRRLSHQHT